MQIDVTVAYDTAERILLQLYAVTAGGLIQLLGISGIAVGFAFTDIFQNFIAGILLLVTEPFSTGDEISVSGFEGTVEDVQKSCLLPPAVHGHSPRAATFPT